MPDRRVTELAMRLAERRVVEQAEADQEDLDDDRRHEDPGHHGERHVQIADHPTPPIRYRFRPPSRRLLRRRKSRRGRNALERDREE